MASSGRVSAVHGFNKEGRKWKGFSSVSNELELAVFFLYFNEAEEEGVFGVLEDGEGIVGVLTKEEVEAEDLVSGVVDKLV